MVESTLFRGIFAPNQRTHPVAGALGDSSNSPGRRVKNLVNEERQIVIAAKKNPNAIEEKMPDHTMSEVKSFPIFGVSCNPRTNQNFSKTAIDGFCATRSASNQDKNASQVVPLSKQNLSLS
ncbi:hypothetical protein V6N11_013458 [Hibiscus sabdariffa]|uniref:Uncharacterized protein n=1 Tax=Hibiscus sabdariffa TaxID=183260 RepID=A0ABR2NND4_9ROSI